MLCSTLKEFIDINSRKNCYDVHSIYTFDQLHDSARLHSSKTLVQSSVFRSRDEFSRHSEAIIFSQGVSLEDRGFLDSNEKKRRGEPHSAILVCLVCYLFTLKTEQQNHNCERFEPRSHFKSRLNLTVLVNVVFTRTVVVDSD